MDPVTIGQAVHRAVKLGRRVKHFAEHREVEPKDESDLRRAVYEAVGRTAYNTLVFVDGRHDDLGFAYEITDRRPSSERGRQSLREHLSAVGFVVPPDVASSTIRERRKGSGRR